MTNEPREIKICKYKIETECILNVALLTGYRMASGKQRHFQNHGAKYSAKNDVMGHVLRSSLKLLQLCCNNNLYICNGRINNDLTGVYTCTRGS